MTLVVMGIATWQAFAEQRREDAAWKRVGTCDLIPNTEQVSCDGVSLVELQLPSKIAACGGEPGGVCSVKVNQQALPAFQSAIAEIVTNDLQIELAGPVERMASCFLHGFTKMPVRIAGG